MKNSPRGYITTIIYI